MFSVSDTRARPAFPEAATKAVEARWYRKSCLQRSFAVLVLCQAARATALKRRSSARYLYVEKDATCTKQLPCHEHVELRGCCLVFTRISELNRRRAIVDGRTKRFASSPRVAPPPSPHLKLHFTHTKPTPKKHQHDIHTKPLLLLSRL